GATRPQGIHRRDPRLTLIPSLTLLTIHNPRVEATIRNHPAAIDWRPYPSDESALVTVLLDDAPLVDGAVLSPGQTAELRDFTIEGSGVAVRVRVSGTVVATPHALVVTTKR